MNTELKNAVKATDKDAQYDTSAKRLLGQKSILAHILVKTVDEFKGMNPKDVVDCIEGTPHISTVPVEPGLTNAASEKNGERLVGFNTENEEINEGLVRFDIVFYVRMKDGLSQIIINVEAQKDEPKGYEILNRAIFYVSRLISSQKERDFENSSYDDIKRVYSIWVCMNMEESSMSHVHLTKEDLIGSYQWKGNLDLLNIIMLGLAKNLPEHDETYELHRLLGALLSQELTIDEKLNIIGNEYDIPIEENFRKDVSVMCNLSQGIEEKGIAIGEARKEEKIILFVGRLDEIKGLGELIFTFKKLLQIDPYCHLVIVGDGFYSYYLNSCNPTWNKITFTGKLNKEDLYKLYQIADIGVLPSFHEQCSYVAIEMMMYGIPLVASTSTGLSEMIEDGVSGYHIPIIEYENHTDLNTYELQSKLLILLKDSSMRKEMAKNSRLRYERYYTSEIFSSCMQEFYNRFVL